jgi:hypothetical protein
MACDGTLLERVFKKNTLPLPVLSEEMSSVIEKWRVKPAISIHRKPAPIQQSASISSTQTSHPTSRRNEHRPIQIAMKPGTRIMNMPRAAAALAALAFANPSAHAAPAVWNVNIGDQVTTSDNFAGAAVENTTPNSFWNSVTTTPTGLALNDSTEAATTATLTMSAVAGLGFGNQTLNSGPEIFNSWTNGNSNSVFTMTLEGLDSSSTYDLIVYSDWWWNNGANFPVAQTVGTGLTGTLYLNHIKTGTNGTVPGLVEDTGLVENDSSQGNWIRITGLTPDGSGNLGFNMGGQNAALNGFQLVQVPEPSSLLLGGLGLLAMLRRCR